MPGREPRTAECGRCFIIHHIEPPQLEDAQRELERYLEFTAEKGYGPVMLVPDKIFPPMGSDVRALYRKTLNGEPGVEAMVTVVGGLVGLGASLVSSIITQVFAGRSDEKVRMIREVEDAAEWLCEVANVQAEPAEIVEVVEKLRAEPPA